MEQEGAQQHQGGAANEDGLLLVNNPAQSVHLDNPVQQAAPNSPEHPNVPSISSYESDERESIDESIDLLPDWRRYMRVTRLVWHDSYGQVGEGSDSYDEDDDLVAVRYMDSFCGFTEE